MEIIFTDRFLDRVEKISGYIALDNISQAIEWSKNIFNECEKLQNNPRIGRIVPEFQRPEIRELIHGHNYRLIYEVEATQVDMLTVWHARQQFPESPGEL
jgi:addiction module RelE/StbE family toxin